MPKAINWSKMATKVTTENVDNWLKLTNQSLTDTATISASTYQIGTTYTQNVYTYESGINMNIAAPSAKIIFGSDVQLTEGLTAEGAYYTDDVTIEGDVIIETRLTVDNQTILNNNLSVAGNTSLQDTTAKEIDCVTLDRTYSDADFLVPTTIGSASATWSTYESMPLIVDGTTKYRPGETNRQSLTFTHTSSDYNEGAKYANKFNQFDADISGWEISPGYTFGFSETYTNYNILNTNGISNGYGSTINCFDAAVRGKTTTQGGGAGAIFEVIADNDSAYLLPFNAAVKGVFSSAQNSGTGSTVGYFGYGYGTGSEGTAVGVCGYGTKASTNVYTAGIWGVGYPSSLSNRNWSIIGTLGHIGVANGSLFSMNSALGTNYIHPSAWQNTTTFPANELLHFDYTDGGCLHVSSTAEFIGPVFAENTITFGGIADDDHVHDTGQIWYSTDTNTLNVDTEIEDVVLQVGQENYIRVRNTSDATINNGDVVKVYDATGHTPEIELAAADDDCPCAVIGVATHSIANNGYGYVTIFGLVHGLNTTQQPGWTEGTVLYLSTTPGQLTDTPPAAPNHVTAVCVITYAHDTNGSVLVRLGVGRPSTALSDFSRTTPSTNGYVPMWNNTGGYYEPSEITADDVDFSGRQIHPSSIITGPITATSITATTSLQTKAVYKNTTIIYATYSTTTTDHVILASSVPGAFTITLSTADCVDGREIIIKDRGGQAITNNITIATEGSEQIDGSSTYTIARNYGSVALISDGSSWYSIN